MTPFFVLPGPRVKKRFFMFLNELSRDKAANRGFELFQADTDDFIPVITRSEPKTY